MILTIQPSDLIKRCLWNEYKEYCLVNQSDEEIEKTIIEDKPFTISEEDAYVIGLLKVVETENLIHRFKLYIQDLLKVRSNLFENKLYINRNIILNEVKSFKKRFPDSFKPNFIYRKSIDELMVYIDDVYEKLSDLETHSKIINDKNYIFVLSNKVKDIINS